MGLCKDAGLNYTNEEEIRFKGLGNLLCIKNKTFLSFGGSFSA